MKAYAQKGALSRLNLSMDAIEHFKGILQTREQSSGSLNVFVLYSTIKVGEIKAD